jgi:hypothetical protein
LVVALANAGLPGQEAGDGCGVPRILFMPERDDAQASGLCQTAKIRDRDTGHTVDRLDAIESERLDDEVPAVCQVALGIGGAGILL